MSCGVYRIFLVSTGRSYVGSSVSIEKRWHQHRYWLRRDAHHSFLLQRGWNKNGEKAYGFEILDVCSEDRLLEREQHWLDALHISAGEKGYNVALVAGSTKGRSVSEETRQRLREANLGKKASEQARANMSASRRGKTSHNKGKSHSVEARQKMSAARIGVKRPPSVGEKVSAAITGRPKSKEHRAKIAASLRGRTLPPRSAEHSAKISAALLARYAARRERAITLP